MYCAAWNLYLHDVATEIAKAIFQTNSFFSNQFNRLIRRNTLRPTS